MWRSLLQALCYFASHGAPSTTDRNHSVSAMEAASMLCPAPALANARAACMLRPFSPSRAVIGATDSRNVAFHGTLQDLLRT